jgi:hypothetical protein
MTGSTTGKSCGPRRDDARSGGISIVDARLNGSALVRPMDGMLPDDYVDAQFAERPDIDVVASGLAPAARA